MMLRVLKAILAAADVALGTLLIAVSGVIFFGVNNTGPIMPDAIFFGALMLWCFVAPILTFYLRKRVRDAWQVALVASPVAVFLIALAMPA